MSTDKPLTREEVKDHGNVVSRERVLALLDERAAARARAAMLAELLPELDRLEKFSHELRDREHPRTGLGDGERASLQHARIIADALSADDAGVAAWLEGVRREARTDVAQELMQAALNNHPHPLSLAAHDVRVRAEALEEAAQTAEDTDVEGYEDRERPTQVWHDSGPRTLQSAAARVRALATQLATPSDKEKP